jgi:hypothetical protein
MDLDRKISVGWIVTRNKQGLTRPTLCGLYQNHYVPLTGVLFMSYHQQSVFAVQSIMSKLHGIIERKYGVSVPFLMLLIM